MPSALWNVPLPKSFYAQDPETVAKGLIGKLLCRRSREGLTVGRVVETEAYLAEFDSASHSFRGPNRKNASMFGLPGRAYVYTIHARQCVNVVTQAQGTGSAVLIRAVEPLIGLELMSRRRGSVPERDLCRGPARLCEAFDICRGFDGWTLLAGRRLWLVSDQAENSPVIMRSTRIGVTSAQQLRLRFFEAGSRWVSGPVWLNASGETV